MKLIQIKYLYLIICSFLFASCGENSIRINYIIVNNSQYSSEIATDQVANIEPQVTTNMSSIDPYGYAFFRVKNSAYTKVFNSYSFKAPPDNWFAIHKEYNVVVTLNDSGVTFDNGEWAEE